MACILPLQGRRTNLPCYHLALRLPRGRTPQRVGCYPSSSITAGLCRRSLAYYYKVSSVRSSKTMFGNAVCTLSHQAGLSVTPFIAYSSFQRFFPMRLYSIYNDSFDLSTPYGKFLPNSLPELVIEMRFLPAFYLFFFCV